MPPPVVRVQRATRPHQAHLGGVGLRGRARCVHARRVENAVHLLLTAVHGRELVDLALPHGRRAAVDDQAAGGRLLVGAQAERLAQARHARRRDARRVQLRVRHRGRRLARGGGRGLRQPPLPLDERRAVRRVSRNGLGPRPQRLQRQQRQRHGVHGRAVQLAHPAERLGERRGRGAARL
mgnify:CR=1 FL=1